LFSFLGDDAWGTNGMPQALGKGIGTRGASDARNILKKSLGLALVCLAGGTGGQMGTEALAFVDRQFTHLVK
jgi:hypothetical protein